MNPSQHYLSRCNKGVYSKKQYNEKQKANRKTQRKLKGKEETLKVNIINIPIEKQEIASTN